MLAVFLQPAHGQDDVTDLLCFDLFASSNDPLLQCADTDYFLDPVGGVDFEFEMFSGNDSGDLEAEFDGVDIFDDPDIEPPENLLEPFFARTSVAFTTDASGNVTGFTFEHRGSVSMTPRDSDFQGAAYQTRSRLTFKPINLEPEAPLLLDFDLDYDFTLADPLENATRGAALGGLGLVLRDNNKMPAEPGGPVDTEYDVSLLGQLDVDPLEPNIEEDLEFFGFEDPDIDPEEFEIDFEPDEPEIDDVFDVSFKINANLEIDPEIPDGELEPELSIEIDTFGSIFSDGFESGDVSAWSASSPDTMRFTVTSPDPNVRFIIVGLEDIPMPTPSAPELKIVRRNEAQGGKVALSFASVEGQKYRIDSSTDLQNFTPLTDLTGTGNVVEFIDASSQAEAVRYYQLVVPQ